MRIHLEQYGGWTVREQLGSLARYPEAPVKFWLSRRVWELLYLETAKMCGVRVDEYEPGKAALMLPASGVFLRVMCDPTLGEWEAEAK